MLKLKETNHPYYCEKYSTNNYQEYCSWKHFNDEYEVQEIDHDLNFLVRYDLRKNHGEDNYRLSLFYIQQRRGRFVPVIISNITKDDFKEIDGYLKNCWNYMQDMWEEFSEQEDEI